jgi:hypothetical protein
VFLGRPKFEFGYSEVISMSNDKLSNGLVYLRLALLSLERMSRVSSISWTAFYDIKYNLVQ